MKTTPEWNEYFFDMGVYWTETGQPQKIRDCRDKYGYMVGFQNRIKWLDKGIAKANLKKRHIELGIE